MLIALSSFLHRMLALVVESYISYIPTNIEMFVMSIMGSNDFGMGGREANVPDAAGPSQVEAFSLRNGRSRGCGSLFRTVVERNPR